MINEELRQIKDMNIFQLISYKIKKKKSKKYINMKPRDFSSEFPDNSRDIDIHVDFECLNK